MNLVNVKKSKVSAWPTNNVLANFFEENISSPKNRQLTVHSHRKALLKSNALDT
jgi:hypothetical protein